MSVSKIVAILLVKNEDLFIDSVITNLLNFCDEIIVADNLSTDGTAEKIKRLTRQYSKIVYHRIDSIASSHDLISGYAGENVWVFGVDGDEIYDSLGLAHFREELLAGKYDKWWMIFGNVLHCTALNSERKIATGHFSPPLPKHDKIV